MRNVLLGFAAVVTLTGCGISSQQELEMGAQTAQEINSQIPLVRDAEINRYINVLGDSIARLADNRGIDYTFYVVDAMEVNAFAVPGGYIYVNRGLITRTTNLSQLAGVLGHEIGHVTARHAAQQYTQATSAGLGLTLLSIFVPETRPLQGLAETAMGVLFLKHGRDDELQADRLGADYTAKTGWDPRGVAGMLRTLQRLDQASGSNRGVPNFLATHPAPGDRVERVLAYVQQNPVAVGTSGRPSDEREYQRVVDGIIFGDSPSDGIIRGNQFLHPDLRLALAFPQGWEIQNSASQVVAKAPDRNNFMLLQIVPNASGSLQQVAQGSMANAGFRQLQGERASLNGLDAYVGTYQGAMEGLGNVVTVAAHVVHNRSVYMFAGLAPPNEFQGVQQQFVASIRSFRELSQSEAAGIKPNRIDIYTVRGGDTWQSLAARSGNLVKPSTLAIMNNYEPNQAPRAGDQIRLVVEG